MCSCVLSVVQREEREGEVNARGRGVRVCGERER
jgi:hypothetical protein